MLGLAWHTKCIDEISAYRTQAKKMRKGNNAYLLIPEERGPNPAL
jgi:hypothetical protein